MAIFKCKMCGGDLEINEGVIITECEYCGTKQTVPKAMDENLQNHFNRANTLRIKSEFDKSERIYEKIIQADSTQAEAYWGLILCKYGIEYVDDPTTLKKIPTCHRASYDSIIADEDYKSALKYAEPSQKIIYEEQAKEIDRIQKDILALAQKEERYDVFICYKETDVDGKRTQDSVIANDIYYQLTREGFKVFYAAITLEGKLGSAYEPIIFAALNSAKVMLAIGTRPDYFNAVWVKNEWSRYLKIIKKDREKLLIPCYRDMDVYELPEEFAHLQAQDMSKIGFINDVVRGIQKVIKKENEAPNKENGATNLNTPTNIAPLLERLYMFLEDGEWQSADEYCEKILDLDPKNGRAYLGKLMAELKVKQIEELANLKEPFDNHKLYEKVIRFSDEKTRKTIEDCINNIKINKKNAQNENLYNQALGAMIKAKTEGEYKKAAKLFNPIIGYKDADKRIEECLEKAVIARKDNILFTAKRELSSWKDVATIEDAIKSLESIRDWKDAEEQIEILKQKAENLKRLEEAQKIQAKKQKKFLKIFVTIVSAVLITITIFLIILFTIVIPENNYKQMKELIDDEKYTEAYVICKDLNGYKDCEELLPELEEHVMKEAEELYLEGNAGKAADLIDYAGIYYPAYRYVADGNYKLAISSGLTHIVIPDSVTSIGEMVFYNCTSLTSIVIGNSVTSIGDKAFRGCTLLTSMVIPDSVTSIGDDAFRDCDSLTSIEIGDSVTSIGDDAFYNCASLTSVVIPDSVTSIGSYAFEDCTSLTSIVIPDSVTSIGNSAFNGCSSLTSIVIPDSVTSIGDDAFEDCSSLTSIVIPDSVTSIGNYAFRNCTSLTSIVIPDSVTSIGSSAFSGCNALESLTLPFAPKGSDYDTYGDYRDSGLCSYFGSSIPESLKTVKITSGDSIPYRAFSGCTSLTSIVIPDSVTNIDWYAFYDCTSLTDVYYTGSETEWKAISIGYSNSPLNNATKHFNYVAKN